MKAVHFARHGVPSKVVDCVELPENIDPQLRPYLTAYQPPPVLDPWTDEPQWLQFQDLMTIYEMHRGKHRQQGEVIDHIEGLSERQKLAARCRVAKSYADAVWPFILCLDEHLNRLVREHPKQQENVTEIRKELKIIGGDNAAIARSDRALARAIDLILAVHDRQAPLGSAMPTRRPDGSVRSWRWKWAGTEATKTPLTNEAVPAERA